MSSRNNCEFNLRQKKDFNVPLAKTKKLKNTLYIPIVIKYLAHMYTFFLYLILPFLSDFIIVTINLIQLLAAILIKINYLSLSPLSYEWIV